MSLFFASNCTTFSSIMQRAYHLYVSFRVGEGGSKKKGKAVQNKWNHWNWIQKGFHQAKFALEYCLKTTVQIVNSWDPLSQISTSQETTNRTRCETVHDNCSRLAAWRNSEKHVEVKPFQTMEPMKIPLFPGWKLVPSALHAVCMFNQIIVAHTHTHTQRFKVNPRNVQYFHSEHGFTLGFWHWVNLVYLR